MKPLLFVLAAVLVSNFAAAQQEVPACSKEKEERPFEMELQGLPLSKLPKALFVAKVANVYIESSTSEFRLWMTHNFKTGIKEFSCATLPKGKTQNFSFLGPVIYDNTTSKKEGSTIWQFQILVRGLQLGLWNQKSSLVKLDQVISSTEGTWRWIEGVGGNIRLFKYQKLSGQNSVLFIDLERAQ